MCVGEGIKVEKDKGIDTGGCGEGKDVTKLHAHSSQEVPSRD